MDDNNCTWTWTQVNGKNGYLVTGKKAGYTDKSIFLPAAGYMDGVKLLFPNEVGNYWSATLTDSEAKSFSFGCISTLICENQSSRYLGFTIRPVCN